jgi:hypothetical protein
LAVREIDFNTLYQRSHVNKFIVYGFIILLVSAVDSVAQSLSKPATFLLNADFLRTNKEKIKAGDQTLVQAAKRLIADADKTLKHDTYTVTAKSKTPPSGDKHDYMSVGPYWWPDSTKPNGLPYIRKDGQVNPDRFAINDATYLKNLCDDVELLAVTYYFSDDEKYARRAAELLRVWFLNTDTKMNPNLNYGQAIPGITDGRGIGLIDSRAFAKLADAVQLLRGSSVWAPGDHAALQNWFRQFLDWMLTSPIGKDEEDEHNNHGTYYDFQSIGLALFTDNKTLARQIIEQKTMKRIESQLKADGSQPHELARTLSWNYSVMNLQGFFGIALLAENVQIDLWNYETETGKSVKKAFLWLLPYAEGKKSWEHQQIKAIHMDEFQPLATVASAKYKIAEPAFSLGHQQKENSLFILTNSLF